MSRYDDDFDDDGYGTRFDFARAHGRVDGGGPARALGMASLIVFLMALLTCGGMALLGVLCMATGVLLPIAFLLWILALGMACLLEPVGCVLGLIGLAFSLRNQSALLLNGIAFGLNAAAVLGIIGVIVWAAQDFQ